MRPNKTKKKRRSAGLEGSPPISQTETDRLTRAVQEREAQAELAERLSEVDVSHLSEATTDPAMLEHADAERRRVHALELTRGREVRELQVNRDYDRLRREVDTEATWATAREERVHRQVRRGIADADHAAKDVAAIEAALDETRPATAATKLARVQEKIVAGFLLFGGAASVLSAVGIAHAIEGASSVGWVAAIAAAAIVEIPSTTLSSFVIWAQGLLQRLNRSQVTVTEEDGTPVKVDPLAALPSWVRPLAWRIVAGLLVFSIAVNVWGMLWVGVGVWGALGAVGAVIAAASALLGWAFSLQSSAIISANMDSPGVADALDERRRVASGADIPWESAQSGEQSATTVVDVNVVRDVLASMGDEYIAALAGRGTEDLQDHLRRTALDDGSARSDLRELPEGAKGSSGGSARSDQAEHDSESENGSADDQGHGSARSDQAEHTPEKTNAATRAAAERADRRRADALVLWDKGWSAPEIAVQMGRDKRTVRGYLSDQGVSGQEMEQRIRDRVAAYIDEHGPKAETRAMARDLHLTRTEAKDARQALSEDGVEVYSPDQQ